MEIRRFISTILVFAIAGLSLGGQVVTADKLFPGKSDELVITFHADRGNQGLKGFSGDVYAHTGVITPQSISMSDWKFVKTNWGQNTTETKLERIAEDKYELTISPNVIEYYGITANQTVLKLAFVFRSANNTRTGREADGSDILLDLYDEGLFVRFVEPAKEELLIEINTEIFINAVASESSDITLFINDTEVASDPGGTITYTHTASVKGLHWIIAEADNGTDIARDSLWYFARTDPPVAELPPNVVQGPNYIDDNTAIVVLHDPPAQKEFAFVIGDFNDWILSEKYYMNRTPDGEFFWLMLEDLTPGFEYAYQYYIDGDLKIADPYTHKILDPWHDQYISSSTYPGLKSYPEGKTNGIVSILRTAGPEFEWDVTDFDPPQPQDLVIYELLIRDFVGDSDIKTVTDTLDYLERLGVNAIELMPINEFEGNDSWGYNPSFYFATDKAYGRMDDYKRFIDECHKRGIAVIIDMVLNHSFSQSPLLQMYFNPDAGQYGQPTANNPWYNEVCPHPPWCWGYDFDHESPYTREFVDRVNRYWLEEFRVDGFRFDFTKGFTNNQTANQGASYDPARVAILKRMADEIWEVNDRAYVILEHFTENREEAELADYGMLVWGNMNYRYNEATMGYIQNSNLSGISYSARNWDLPHLIGYMESHDEERLMFKNLNYGNSASGYNTRSAGTALRRMEQAAAFFFTVPGPKMIWQFGELGYDYSINHCPDGTIDEACRTSRKPVRWDYSEDWRRKRLYDVYSMLINLRKNNEVFSTDDFSTSLGGDMKRIHLNHPSNRVAVLGNFGVTGGEISPNFQESGTWFEFFSRETLEVDDTNAPINLEPGEYRLYSTAEFPDHGVALGSEKIIHENNEIITVYPNPASNNVNITISVDRIQHVGIGIYNIQGQKVASVLDQALSPGYYDIKWDCTSHNGERVPPGVYVIKINLEDDNYAGRKLLIIQ